MKVEFETIILQKLKVEQLEEVIEHTFGFYYDIYESEELLEEANIEYEVTPHAAFLHSDSQNQSDKNSVFWYYTELHKIKNGMLPEEHSLHIILNELCERGQLDEGEYFI